MQNQSWSKQRQFRRWWTNRFPGDVTSTPEQLGKPIGSDSENGKTTFVTLYGVDGAMALAQKLNEQICSDLQQHFGAKAAFLQQLAQQLLVRKN